MSSTKWFAAFCSVSSVLLAGCAELSNSSDIDNLRLEETTRPVLRDSLDQRRPASSQSRRSPLIGSLLDGNQEWEPVVESADARPPDPNIAVGLNHVFIATNPTYVVDDKATPGTAPAPQVWTNDKFWAATQPVGVPAGAQDPYVIFDFQDGAFYIVALENQSLELGTSRLLLAVCDQDPSQLSNWKTFRMSMLSTNHPEGDVDYGVPNDNGFVRLDRPSVRTHGDHIYITFWGEWCDDGTVSLACLDGSFPFFEMEVAIIAIPKSEVFGNPSGTRLSANGLLMPDPYRTNALIAPAPSTDGSQGEPYWVGIDRNSPARRAEYRSSTSPNTPFDELTLFKVTNPQTAPLTLTSYNLSTVLPYYHPYSDRGFVSEKDKGARQKPATGTPQPLSLTDGRILSAVRHNNTIWAAHHVRRDTTTTHGTVIRWYKIELDPTPQILEANTIDFSGEVQSHSFYPSVAVNSRGVAALTFNVSSEDESVSVQIWRQRLTPPGEAQMLKTSDVDYDQSGSSPQRWGDYSATVVDPSDESIFWGISEWVGDNNTPMTWSTWAYAHEYCFADCDQSTGEYVLDAFDFLCFQDAFIAGDPYACDCDTTTGLGVCDLFDFLCFQNAFTVGCN